MVLSSESGFIQLFKAICIKRATLHTSYIIRNLGAVNVEMAQMNCFSIILYLLQVGLVRKMTKLGKNQCQIGKIHRLGLHDTTPKEA